MNKNEILRNVRERMGIAELNDMQLSVLNHTAPNLLVHSPTGSGKTVAFTSLMLLRTKTTSDRVGSIIVAPSRELVVQIADVVRRIAYGQHVVALYGGHSMETEKNQLDTTPQIIVATPGRLVDHINRGNIDITKVQTVVLDEYDKSLELGFEREMKRIVSLTQGATTMILTSATLMATMPSFIKSRHFAAVDFTVNNAELESRIEVVEVASSTPDKLQTAIDLLRSLDNGKVLLFVNNRESAERVYSRLIEERLPAGLYHGALDQLQRETAVVMFENGTTPILVATDLAARGLDIEAVDSVVHYHLPISEDVWRHRNGRTARVDASGIVYVIFSETDNRPAYINPTRKYVPKGVSAHPIHSTVATLYINAGRRNKISRGDVVGFLCQKGGMSAQQIGKIVVMDNCALVAVPRDKAYDIMERVRPHKLKNQRVRITEIK